MNTLRTVLVALAIIMGSLLAVTPASAATGGIVSGDMEAYSTGSVSICAVNCVDKDGYNPGWNMKAPDFYATDTQDKTGTFQSKVAVDAGTYKLYFSGFVYDREPGRGYLQATSGGYKLVPSFEDGTDFTVLEGQALDLGKLNLQLKGSGDVNVDAPASIASYGNAGAMDLKVKNVPAGATMIFKTYGCGKLQLTRKTTKTGSYTYKWSDPDASTHYGEKLKLVPIVKYADGTTRTIFNITFDVSKFNWGC